MSDAASEPPAPATWGVFCLANDAVLEWALALFESLREFGRDLPVRVIPYDERQDLLAPALAVRGHDYWRDPEIESWHALGQRFYPDDDFAARGFRKLAAFAGPFERFFVLDTDVLALSPLADLCRAIERSDADLVHFDTDVDQVYRPGPLLAQLAAHGGARGFNAGLFSARRGTLSARRASELLEDLGPDWRRLLVPNAEQPFFNLAAERAGLRLVPAHELLADTCSTCWPAVGELVFDGSAYRLRGSTRWDEGWRFQFAHWAGYKLAPGMPNRAVWELFRRRAAR